VKEKPAASPAIIHFENPRYQTWLSNTRSLFPSLLQQPVAQPKSIIDKPIQQRVKVAYNESAFSFSCQDNLMVSVVSNNMANWFGYDSIVMAQ